MKLSYNLLMNPALTSALVKLREVEFPIATLYQLKKMYSEVVKERENYRDLLKTIVNGHSELDEKGNVKTVEGNPNAPQIKPDMVESFKNKLIELNTLEVELTSKVSIKLASLPATLKLNMNEIDALDGIFPSE